MGAVNKLLLLLCVTGLTACTSSRVSRYDEYEKVKVDRMVGNEVSSAVFARTVVCLNAMREAKWPPARTNETVNYVTNVVVSSTTNLTISTSANQQAALATNAFVLPPSPPTKQTDAPASEAEAAPAVAVPATPDSNAGGYTVATTRNESVAAAPNQSVVSTTTQTVTTLNQQTTVNTNNQSVVTGMNEVVTVETNMVVTTVTNLVITPATNTTVTAADRPAFDYYVSTEIAPADFALQSGESLVLLVDGARYALAPVTPQVGWSSRRGFLTTFYRATPEMLVGIANAHEVKLRIKGATGTLDRDLSEGCQKRFKEFLARHFGTQQELATPAKKPSSRKS
jgi:hypothetical protein